MSRRSAISVLAAPRLGKRITSDSQHDDDADDDLLDVGVNIHEDQTVEQHADQQAADNRAKDGPRAPEQAGSTNHHGCDHREFVAGSGNGLRRVEAGLSVIR